MNINYDGTIVTFKTEPEDLFMAEKSGAKPNTVRIIDSVERQQLIKKLPEKIIIQHGHEIFLRTVTHVHVSETILGKYIAIFSWTNEKHNTSVMIEVEGAAPIEPQSNLRLPVPLIHDLIGFSGNDTVPMFLSKLLEQYRTKRAEERGPIRD